MTFERATLHDNALQYLINNNFYYFKAPLYQVDPEIAPLRNLLNQKFNISNEKLDHVWDIAINDNPFYQSLYNKFGPKIHNENFIRKVGDFIIDFYRIWLLVELKTSKNHIFNINFDSLIAYDSLPIESRNYIHFIFYDGQNFWMVRYNDLFIKPVVFVYPEIFHNQSRIRYIRVYIRFYEIRTNSNQNTPLHINRSTNAYVKVNLKEQCPGVVQTIPEHMNTLRGNFYFFQNANTKV